MGKRVKMTLHIKKRLLIQTQLSNYTPEGRFVLEADSGYQMCIGRVREMLKLNQNLEIHIMGPMTRESDEQYGTGQLVTDPWDINPDLFKMYKDRLKYIPTYIEANALATRYNFDVNVMDWALGLKTHKSNESLRYDAVYINDPMHLRNFKALFLLRGGYQPKFYVHSHFVDVPSCPKFPLESSLWHGQLESAIKADYNFWQCSSALVEFEREARKTLQDKVVDEILAKSAPWDDGYSSTEITQPVNEQNLRFSLSEWSSKTKGKIILFFPNRISPSSNDYTNGMKWMFDVLPELRKHRQDFVVICGNPNMKFSNIELFQRCGNDGYVKLHDFTLNRDEYRFVARNSHIAISLYDRDTYGSTSIRECIELGCVPLWINKYEYKEISNLICWPYSAKQDMSDIVLAADTLIEVCKNNQHNEWIPKLQNIIRNRCSYEQTVPHMMKLMGIMNVFKD